MLTTFWVLLMHKIHMIIIIYERYSKKELLDMCQDKKIIIKNYHKIAIYKLKLSSSLNDY